MGGRPAEAVRLFPNESTSFPAEAGGRWAGGFVKLPQVSGTQGVLSFCLDKNDSLLPEV